MDFLKKHYEKILLGVMLVGLIGVLVFMLFYIASEKSEMADKSMNLINPRVKELADLDMGALSDAAARLDQPYNLDLETTNRLFNPMEWQKSMDGGLILAASRTGLQVAMVTNIAPLYTIVTLDTVTTNELGVRYVIKVEHQAAAKPSQRRPVSKYLGSNDRTPNDAFTLEDIKGAPENPDELELKLADSGETISIASGKPYRRIDGYTADFRYDPERKAFHGRRVGDRVAFGGEDYTVVDVNQNELILQDQSNQKKTSLPFVP
jgi:hypothetical protein